MIRVSLISFVFFSFILYLTLTPVFAQVSATPVFQTDFENAIKVDSNTLNLTVPHWFEFGDYDGSSNGDGARMWVDTTKGHSGTKSIGLEVSDISKSRRAEFDIWPKTLTGDELSVSQWLYLPADFGLHAPGINWNWYNFNVLYSEYQAGQSDNYLDLTLTQPDITRSIFSLALGGRKPPNSTKYQLVQQNPFTLPRGRWFHVFTYLKRDPVHGAAKVWIDGQLIFDKTEINTKGNLTEFHISPAKVYYETTDTTLHQMWVDDLKIYKGYVEPELDTVASSPTLTPRVFCKSDINQDGLTDLTDYSLLVRNFLSTTPTNPRADINQDGMVNLTDYSLLVSNFLKTSCS